ncbi:MAG: PASTA domain-containing protein [Bacteroidia bacterium]
MTTFLTNRKFWIHLSIAALTACILAFVAFKLLNTFTRHGQNVEVPNFIGKKVTELNTIFANLPLSYEVVDSIFDPKQPKGTVLDQTPQATFKVKEHRIIYLTVNASTPPKLKMPNLKDASLRQAESVLLSYGLVVGKLSYKPDYAKDAVLEQRYKGKSIKAGELLPYGASIDLVLGDGMEEASSADSTSVNDENNTTPTPNE